MKHNGMGTLLCSLLLLGCARQPAMESLVPKEPSGAPDYYVYLESAGVCDELCRQ